MVELFLWFVNEIASWVSWLGFWSIYGIPFLYYIMGFTVLGLLMDYIFG